MPHELEIIQLVAHPNCYTHNIANNVIFVIMMETLQGGPLFISFLQHAFCNCMRNTSHAVTICLLRPCDQLEDALELLLCISEEH